VSAVNHVPLEPGKSESKSPLRVSVLVNTYNHERFIEQALNSVAQQDYPTTSIETIVVDDGSTDATPKIVERYVPRVRLIRKANGGQVSALGAGARWCTGDVVAFLDGDDWWARDKITRVLEAFRKYPDVAAVGHGFYETDEMGLVKETRILKSEYRLSFRTPDATRFATRLRTFGGTSKLAIRRAVFERSMPVPLELPFFDNFLFFLAIAASGAVLLPDPLCYYRLHSANLYASELRDESRLRRKCTLERGLAEKLPQRLAEFGMSPDVIATVVESDRLDAERLRLILEGGWPWETFRVERAHFRAEYRNPDIGYLFFKYFVLLTTLVLPPKAFYWVREWYARHDLKKLRERIGSASPAVPDMAHTVERRGSTARVE
jgi:glycosyltransferase involved in cell wall biosynthesis